MRRRLIAGNWKMNTHWNEALTLVAELAHAEGEGNWKDADVAIFPPSLYTRHVFEFIQHAKSGIAVGVQNCASTENGAYTGELSASMLREVGVNAVLIGHSERREYFQESNETLLAKTKLALGAQLTPYFCCGEQLQDRKSEQHKRVVTQQLSTTVLTLSRGDMLKTVIAYEPVWAIGTGETASPEQAQEMHALIRQLIAEAFDQEVAAAVRILYGGSMKPDNANALLSQPDVDGGLIGGASLKAADFSAIIRA
ncbi:MAG: triose-phosphate isomerase [Flavobacteriales bacterium]|nr:triose-phosphate isomerase [Flavobacteriales bacterium]